MAQESDQTTGDRVASFVGAPVRVLFRLLETPLSAIQRGIGIKRMPWIFLLPNLVFFGLFVILPLFINFFYSLTGGTQLYLSDRPFIGTEQYSFLLDCETFTDPQTCREDRFWKGI
ncbi:MAG: sugar ABC transporter permease, partial [Pseudomonadota bacterium]